MNITTTTKVHFRSRGGAPVGPSVQSDGRVPHHSLRPLTRRRARLARLRCPSPAREDGHAVLLTQALVGTPVGFDLFAQAAFALNDLQQFTISLRL